MNCIEGLQAQVNAAMKALPRPKIVVARDEHASEVWSDYYQHTPRGHYMAYRAGDPPMNAQTRRELAEAIAAYVAQYQWGRPITYPERKPTMIDTGIVFVIEYIDRFVIPTSRDIESTQDKLSNIVFTAGRAVADERLTEWRFEVLCRLAADTINWATAIDGDDSRDAFVRVLRQDVRAEWERAHYKYEGNTPAHPTMPDMDRAAILVAQVGEVAKALTGHAGNLRDKLVQVAAMAVAWASALRDDQTDARHNGA